MTISVRKAIFFVLLCACLGALIGEAAGTLAKQSFEESQ
jgi:hypothetical protein